MQGAEGTNDSRTLDFGDGDESLPWLESDDEQTQTGFDTTKLIGIALLMIVALGVIVGAIWWFTNSTAAGGPEPDGSLVEAPDERMVPQLRAPVGAQHNIHILLQGRIQEFTDPKGGAEDGEEWLDEDPGERMGGLHASASFHFFLLL